MSRLTALSVIAILSVGLAACDTARETLGLNKRAPDEFAVVPRAPLVLPPNYDLRPPEPGMARPQEQTPAQTARAALTGNAVPGTAPTGGSEIEQAVLAATGADRADPGIRSTIAQENTQLVEASDSFVNSLLFWQEQPEPGTVIDAGAEQRRLQSNQAVGRAATDGESPIIERKRRGLLEGIF
ncbi:hypothetical protein GCM10011505_33100 [Tistrella bauzanensis]|uniref:DUF3035 domain-containing protein n=1 Tax=Tistrella bauzanensis TaxID=657419 RepID=A0ABQ1IRF6_9PROT|nr:DUF3035 domain-containing protein [Tistrella bauzanensis]GGB49394.1 hypothetical protein GCM10011505_33100 [Tistrella bauzanensis]